MSSKMEIDHGGASSHFSSEFLENGLSFEWKINLLSELLSELPIRSPLFHLTANREHALYLKLCMTRTPSRECFLELDLCNIAKRKMIAECTITVAWSWGKPFYTNRSIVDFSNCGDNTLLPKIKVSSFSLLFDFVIIACSMKFMHGKVNDAPLKPLVKSLLEENKNSELDKQCASSNWVQNNKVANQTSEPGKQCASSNWVQNNKVANQTSEPDKQCASSNWVQNNKVANQTSEPDKQCASSNWVQNNKVANQTSEPDKQCASSNWVQNNKVANQTLEPDKQCASINCGQNNKDVIPKSLPHSVPKVSSGSLKQSKSSQTAVENPDHEELKKLSFDLKRILNESINADVSIRVEDTVIRAHKTILCARSPVFCKMFEHSTLETATNDIEVTDIRFPIMNKLINYLYCGEKPPLQYDEACELYYAADKYEVLDLREACAMALLCEVGVNNACELLSLANSHGDDAFKDKVMRFISNNFKVIVNTDAWMELTEKDTKLAAFLMRFCAKALTV